MELSVDLVFQPSLTPVLSWGPLIRVPLLSSSLRNTNSAVFSLHSAKDRWRPLAVASTIEFSQFVDPFFHLADFIEGMVAQNSGFDL